MIQYVAACVAGCVVGFDVRVGAEGELVVVFDIVSAGCDLIDLAADNLYVRVVLLNCRVALSVIPICVERADDRECSA